MTAAEFLLVLSMGLFAGGLSVYRLLMGRVPGSRSTVARILGAGNQELKNVVELRETEVSLTRPWRAPPTAEEGGDGERIA